MAWSKDVPADDRTQGIFFTGVIWLLFVLASLNEIATTDPGVPLVAPGIAEVLVVAMIGLAVIGGGIVVNAAQVVMGRSRFAASR